MTGKLNSFFTGLVLLFISVSCGTGKKQQMGKDEYIETLKTEKTNILYKTIGDITWRVIYKPLDYVVLAENKAVDAESFEALKAEYGTMEYYTLELEIANFNDEILKYKIQSGEEYNQKVEYYSFKFQQDIKQIIGKDTMPCVSYHFERNYGISPKIRFNVAFMHNASTDNRTIYINDKYLGTGPVKMTFSQEELNNLPVLKF